MTMRPLFGIPLIFLLSVRTHGQDTSRIPPAVQNVLEARCYSCHDAETQKGKVRLDGLSGMPLGARLDLLNHLQEQVYSGEMPPKKKDAMKAEDRAVLLAWVSGELAAHKASTLEDKLRYYRYGNYVDHERLFSGAIQELPFTPARRWRINELIYSELINEVFGLKGKDRRDSFYGVVKPFNLPTESGVKYYDHETVEGGQFLTLLSSAKWVVEKQLRSALVKSGDFKQPPEYLEAEAKGGRNKNTRFPDEAWNPRQTPAAFERVILAQGAPSESDFKAAIAQQFTLVLQRPPTPEEVSRYLGFTQSAATAGGRVRALKNMMVSVLMEPEFVYRSEFGGGTPDAQGRKTLTPREASYAIAYALTDRVPDEALVKAAQEGRLASRDDYRREVLRILEEDRIEKPRILRFFQDYFGYYRIYDVFKDEERFVGNYNPHRVVSTKYIYRIPGKVSDEADSLVKWVLRQDKDVLKTLLTTDRFFVHHNGDNQEMKARAEKAAAQDKHDREVYNRLKSAGRDLEKAAQAFPEYLDKDGKVRRALGYDMKEFEILYGKDGNLGLDRKPIPKDGLEHSIKMYNLDFRTWSYEAVQPVRLEHRMGLLTHPAWLVSFSQNAHTDPVRRGRWIREKLLAGFIPDVPITVDAKVPEDPHATLRGRFAVTEKKECWNCHRKMNPLGYPFESFDDFGRYRSDEPIEYPENILETHKESARGVNGPFINFSVPVYKALPVNPRGFLDGTDDPALDGDVKDAKDLIDRLARSTRVRQSFIRHVFRYFMGRNEMLSDSLTLVAADRAYLESGGSFKALVVSLLTSDSFIYRK